MLRLFRAIDTHDVTKELLRHRQEVDFTTVLRDRFFLKAELAMLEGRIFLTHTNSSTRGTKAETRTNYNKNKNLKHGFFRP